MKSIYSTVLKSLTLCLLLCMSISVFGQLGAWTYVAPVTITENSGSPLTDYQVLIQFDTQTPIAAGKMQASGADLRVAEDINGVSLLNFWVEKGMNTTTTNVWVKIPSIAASSTVTIYFFYGNPTALSASNVDSVLDPFSDGAIPLSGTTVANCIPFGNGDGNYGTYKGFTYQNIDEFFVLPGGTVCFDLGNSNDVDISINLDVCQTDFNGSDSCDGTGYLSILTNKLAAVPQGNTTCGDFELCFTVDSGYHFVGGEGIKWRISSAGAFSSDGSCTGVLCGTTSSDVSGKFVRRFYWDETGSDNSYIGGFIVNGYTRTNTVASEPTGTTGTETLVSSIAVAGGNICSGDSMILAVVIDSLSAMVLPLTYLWSPSTDLSCTSCDSAWASPTVTTTYQMLVTDSTGFQDSTSATIFVANSLPVAGAGNDTTICEGESLWLDGSGGPGYSWSPGADLSDSTIVNPIASPLSTTTYIVSVANGCGNDADTVLVTVALLPVLLSSDTGLCPGDTLPLSASGATTYAWSPGGSLSNAAIANPLAYPMVTTSYTLNATSAFGCVKIDSVMLVVDTVPEIFADATQDTICIGDSTQLNVFGSTDCNDFDVSTISFNPSSTSGTNVFLSDDQVSTGLPIGFNFEFYCNNYSTFYISSNGFLTFTNNTNSGCCSGQNIPNTSVPNNLIAFAWADINPSSGGSITYNTFGSAPNRTLVTSFNSVPHYGGGGGPITVQVILYEGTNNIEIHTTSMITNGGAHTMGIENIDGTIALTVTGRNSNTTWSASSEGIRFTPAQVMDTTLNYTWTPGTGLSDPNVINPLASPSVTTTYIVEAFMGTCSSFDTLTIYVDTVNTISASADTSVCYGDSVLLTATGSGLYNWTPTGGLSCTNCASPYASPIATTKYYVSSPAGCAPTDSVTVAVNGAPITATTSRDTICSGDSVQLDATQIVCVPGPPIQIGFGTASSFWYGPWMGSFQDMHNQMLYYATELSAAGLVAGNIYNVAFNIITKQSTSAYQNFSLSMGNTSATCLSAAAGYQATSSVLGPISYTTAIGWNVLTFTTPFYWDGVSNIVIESCYDNPNGLGPGGYDYVQYSTGFACDVALPYYSNTSGANGCTLPATLDYAGRGNIQFTCSGIPDSTMTYTWSPTAGLSDPNIADPVATPGSTTTYTVTGMSDGCGYTDSVIVYVDTNNFITVSATSTDICQGDTVMLSVVGTAGMPDTSTWTFTWTPSAGLSNTTIPEPFAYPLANITYHLDVVNACGSFSDSITLLSKTAPNADAGVDSGFCSGGSIQLSASGGVSYLWSPNSFLSCTACDKTNATPPADMTYFVEVTDSFGCTASDSVRVSVNGQPITAVSAKPSVCSPGDTTQLSVVGGCSQVGTVQIGFGTTSSFWYGPWMGSFQDMHNQMLYFASELAAAGLVAGNIYNVAFNVITKQSTSPYQNFTVSMGNTSATCLSVAAGYQGTATVLGPVNYTTALGWNVITFTTPFYWDGVSNIVIETCYDNPNGLGPGGYDYVQYSSGFACDVALPYYSNTSGANGCTLPATLDYAGRGNIQFSCLGNTLDTSMAFSWTPASTVSDSSIMNPIASPLVTTSYIVSANDQGCITTDTITVYIDTTILQTSADTGFCTGASSVITVSSTTPVASYSWSPSTGLSSTVVQSPTASPIVTTLYTVDVTGVTGCTQTDSVLISVADAPVVGFISAISGLDVTLTNQTTNASTYLWDFGDGYLSSLQDPTHTYAAAGTYTICLTATNACGSFTYCVTVVLTATGCVSTVAAFDTIMVGSTVVFTDLSSDADTWSWDFGDGNTSNSQNPVNTYASVDSTYNVCLITGNPCSADTVCKLVTIVVSTQPPPCTAPVAIFTSNSVGLDALFIDGSSDAQSWVWDFGDGFMDTVQNPVHTYSVDGSYTVCLIVTNACSSDTTCSNILVMAATCTATVAGFTSSVSGLSADFTDASTDATSWSWDFGDGNTSSSPNPTNLYATSGTYNVCLVVTNPCSSDSICSTITATACSMPVASFASSSSNLVVSFVDASSNATSWSWDFGDGNTSTAQNPTNTYTAAGTYTVCQYATSSCGTDSLCTSLTVISGCTMPTSSFGSSSSGLTFTFADGSTGATSWAWYFGDGNTSTAQNPTNTYIFAGVYNVCLAVTNSCGTDSICNLVTAVACNTPTAGYGATTNSLTATFADASTGGSTWFWDFGDGNTSNLQSPTYTYSAAGSYSVCQSVSNGCDTATFCDSVTVSSCDAVFAIFTYSANTLTVDFSDLSVNAGNWNWDFGDGFTSSISDPTHIYALPGIYMVCLTASSACASDTSCVMITVVLTGIDEASTISSMELYPNPTEGLLNLSIPTDIASDISVKIYNLIGEIVFEANGSELQVIDVSSASTVYSLKLDHLANGSYLLKVQSKEATHMEQFILSK